MEEFREDLTALYNDQKGSCGEVGFGHYSHISDRMKGMGLKLLQGLFRLDIRKKFYSVRVVLHWHRVSREVLKSLSLGVFKERGDVALRDVI